jgi:hypothetical protein
MLFEAAVTVLELAFVAQRYTGISRANPRYTSLYLFLQSQTQKMCKFSDKA